MRVPTVGILRPAAQLQGSGPTIRITLGVCVPDSSCPLIDRLVCCVCSEFFSWERSATAIANRENTHAVKTRRLKKADRELDLVFISVNRSWLLCDRTQRSRFSPAERGSGGAPGGDA